MAAVHQGATFSELIVEALERYGEREAFVLGDRRIRYQEAAALVSQIVQVLASLGVTRGSAVGALSPNVPDVWLVQAASYLLGASYTGLHPLGSADDLTFVCDDAQLTVLVVHPAFGEIGTAVAQRASTVKHVISIGKSELGDDLADLCARHAPSALDPAPAQPEDVAWLQYTGGTTGRPKGVMIPQRGMAAQALAYGSWYGVPEVPRYLATSPITHAALVPIVPTLIRGGTVILHHAFDPATWLRTVQDERINFALTVPTMINVILDHPERDRFDLSSLETLLYGAAPMSPSRIEQALEVFGQVLVQAYGQTESAAIGTVLRKDEHDPVHRPDLLTSCGRATPGGRVEVLDEDGHVMPVGEVGEICFRSPGVMIGYLNQPELTTEVLPGDGWLRSGDLARRDDAGFFHIVDRKKDMIISGGFNIYPKEVEDVLTRHPAVAAAAVIGVPDDKWGEAVKAIVVPHRDTYLDAAALVKLVRDAKGSHHAPKSLEIVDSLPMTAVGKVDKKALKTTYWSHEHRQVH